MKQEEIAAEIAAELTAWADRMAFIGEGVPDFWDELNMPERLGEWLSHAGYTTLDRLRATCIEEMTRHARLDTTGDETKAAFHVAVNWLSQQ